MRWRRGSMEEKGSRARTSCRSTSSEYRMPPLHGRRWWECCARSAQRHVVGQGQGRIFVLSVAIIRLQLSETRAAYTHSPGSSRSFHRHDEEGLQEKEGHASEGAESGAAHAVTSAQFTRRRELQALMISSKPADTFVCLDAASKFSFTISRKLVVAVEHVASADLERE